MPIQPHCEFFDSPSIFRYNFPLSKEMGYALEKHLIDSFDDWTRYHELRNLTTHTYNEEIAMDIVSSSGNFLEDARKLLGFLEGNND